MRTTHDDVDTRRRSKLPTILGVLLLIAALVALAFLMGWIDIDSTGGSVDVDAPENVDVDTDAPDVDVNVDDSGGDADADADK